MEPLIFEADLIQRNGVTVVRLPLAQSERLPSRGMVMGEGMLNGMSFKAPLEPDGKGGHWLEISDALLGEIGVAQGGIVKAQIMPAQVWPEPDIPNDFAQALTSAGLTAVWQSLTVKARWEWFRWIRSTANTQTRRSRIEVACDKLQKGSRRPCCFNAASCTVPGVSKAGILID